MKNKIRIILLALFALYSAYFFIGGTLAPIMAYFQHYDLSARLTSLFIYSCHQQPDRSFWILGYPMALCCRCFGVYFATTFLSIYSIFNKLKINKQTIVILILISLIDVCANLKLGINTGNIIRFIVGIIIGFLIIFTINGIFEIKRRS